MSAPRYIAIIKPGEREFTWYDFNQFAGTPSANKWAGKDTLSARVEYTALPGVTVTREDGATAEVFVPVSLRESPPPTLQAEHCPFCGCREGVPEVSHIGHHPDKRWRIGCGACGARGPAALDPTVARQLWRQRVSLLYPTCVPAT